MTADVEEGTQHPIVITNHNDWFIANIGRHILTGLFELISSGGKMPIVCEDSSEFEIVEIFADVPRCGNGVSPIERRARIVRIDGSLEVVDHVDLSGTEGISLRYLCFLCVSVVN